MLPLSRGDADEGLPTVAVLPQGAALGPGGAQVLPLLVPEARKHRDLHGLHHGAPAQPQGCFPPLPGPKVQAVGLGAAALERPLQHVHVALAVRGAGRVGVPGAAVGPGPGQDAEVAPEGRPRAGVFVPRAAVAPSKVQNPEVASPGGLTRQRGQGDIRKHSQESEKTHQA